MPVNWSPVSAGWIPEWKGVYHSQSGFAVDLTSRRIRWSGALTEGSHWKREHKFSLAELLWYNIRHAVLHE